MNHTYKRVQLVLLLVFSATLYADVQSELQLRLSKISSFSAHFTQKVTDAEGHLIQQSTGQLWLKRPGLFRWVTIDPERHLLVSDGRTVWFYVPSLAQVSTIWLQEAIAQTPCVLLVDSGVIDWSQYQVTQQGDQFMLTPRQTEASLRHYTLTIDHVGAIYHFSAWEADGQCNQFTLRKFTVTPIADQLFYFKAPPGVSIDDQR